ncbi:MAG: hypothetical protein ABFS35_20730 [Bacteroidota bacterium]
MDEYIDQWEKNNKDGVLILFSNLKSDPYNYWEDNLQIVSTIKGLDLSQIKPFVVQELKGLIYEIDSDNELQLRYFMKIKEIIGQILNEKFKIVTINSVSEDFGAGFKFPTGFTNKKSYKDDPKRFKEEFLELQFNIKKEFAKFLRIKVYSEPKNLVFEKALSVNDTIFEWDGKMNKGIKKGEYITREMSKFLNPRGDSFFFLIQIEVSPSREFKTIYKKYTYSKVHKKIKQFLDVIKSKKNFHKFIALYDNIAKNQFRRYIYLKGKIQDELKKGNILKDPLLYFSENIVSGQYFCPKDPKKLQLALHKDFVALIESLKTRNGNKITFSKKHISGGGFNIRLNVNREKGTEQISDHGLGIAFDITTVENTNVSSSSELHNYIHALTKKQTKGIRLESSVSKEVSDELKDVTTKRLQQYPLNYYETKSSEYIREKNNYVNLIKDIGENLKYLSLSSYNDKTKKYEPGYMINNFFDPDKHVQWKNKFIKAQETVSAACNNSLEIVNNSKKNEALLLCEELVNELESELVILQSENGVKNHLGAYNFAFFLEEKQFPIKPLSDNITNIWEYIETMIETLNIFLSILNQNYNEPLNDNIFSQYFMDHNIKRIEITKSYNNTLLELLRIDHILEKYIVSYEKIGNMFKDEKFAGASSVYYVFMYGFTNISQKELDNWLEFDFLEWMGHNRSSKDAMHFQLKASYKDKFFNETKNYFNFKNDKK